MGEEKRVLRCVVAYEGTAYQGWQASHPSYSIRQILSSAFERILQQPIALHGASRTDAGVHAEGQVAHCEVRGEVKSLDRLRLGFNACLPADIRVMELQWAPLDFHATLSAVGKEYHYHLSRGQILSPFLRQTHWHVHRPLDCEKMHEACSAFLGERDFRAFCNARKGKGYEDFIRRIDRLECVIEGERLRFEIEGNRFLYKMVRTVVGTLVYVGLGKLEIGAIGEILAGRRRCEAGMTAPAHGLILKRINYP
ncbi:MAG: tRNA pseudouridine(38-40) synthase TruA [Chlamydiia bacterium]|nr:tRNA pseudouridine(38-40) synthase TruA [Chlamydiia bacterium]